MSERGEVERPPLAPDSLSFPPVPGADQIQLSGQLSVESWQFQSPLPPPAVLRQYEEMIPNFAERYMTAWETQGQHRQRLENVVVSTQATTQRRGQVYALILGLAALVVALILGIMGNTAAAIAVTGIDFGSFGVAFIVSKVREGKELAEKAEAVPERPTPPGPSPGSQKQIAKKAGGQQRNHGKNKKKRRRR